VTAGIYFINSGSTEHCHGKISIDNLYIKAVNHQNECNRTVRLNNHQVLQIKCVLPLTCDTGAPTDGTETVKAETVEVPASACNLQVHKKRTQPSVLMKNQLHQPTEYIAYNSWFSTKSTKNLNKYSTQLH
jgi:hypothetical protein